MADHLRRSNATGEQRAVAHHALNEMLSLVPHTTHVGRLLPAGDGAVIDALLVSPAGIFAVEAFASEGFDTTKRHDSIQEVVRRAEHNAARATERLGRACTPIVVVASGAAPVPDTQLGATWVMDARRFANSLAVAVPKLLPNDVRHCASLMETWALRPELFDRPLPPQGLAPDDLVALASAPTAPKRRRIAFDLNKWARVFGFLLVIAVMVASRTAKYFTTPAPEIVRYEVTSNPEGTATFGPLSFTFACSDANKTWIASISLARQNVENVEITNVADSGGSSAILGSSPNAIAFNASGRPATLDVSWEYATGSRGEQRALLDVYPPKASCG